MAEAALALSPSELVAERYRPLRPLGSGGSGSVWLARDERTGLEVALKIVPREGKAATRAEREALAAARLRHERCLRAYGLERDTRNVYIAYEYVPGQTLRQALRAGEVTDADAVEAGAQILEALAHAHSRGIVHRDVKPSNVLVAEGDELSIRLLDFGLAQLAEEESLTATGDVPGTLAYVPPERLVHGESGGPPADIWAVGVLLWESLAGWHPFWNGSLLETAKRIEAGAAPLAQVRPDLPKPLTALIDRMLAVNPAARPPAARLASDVRDAFAERLRRRKTGTGTTLPPLTLALPIRLAAPAAAGLFAGWTAAALPFYPPQLAPILALLAFGLTFLRPRLGLAFALAVPVLPLGNVSSGLAIVYAALACCWLALSWRAPREGLFLALGPLLAPVLALGLLPLAAQAVRSRPRRAIQVGAAVLLAAIVAGFRHAPLPFTGAAPPKGLGITGSDDPLAVAVALWHGLLAHPVFLLEALALAVAAVLLPLARERGLWAIAGLGAGLIAVTLLPAPTVAAAPFVLAAWATCTVLALIPRG
ncbi:MAG: serine/threonine protein kinase [Actinomycetota bacterium]|nr:serine/threonine protein kinase [Actinomycetota bacterium]